MIYAYHDGADALVLVVLTFGSSSRQASTWRTGGIFEVDPGTEEGREAGAALFGVMSGQGITPDRIANDYYLEKVRPISTKEWMGLNRSRRSSPTGRTTECSLLRVQEPVRCG